MRRSFNLLFGFCFLFLMMCSASLRAQDRKGAVSGRVTDANHGVLPGARVELQPKGQKAVSDDKGEFTISDVAAGHYTLTITYVGFQAFSSETDVTPGQTANVPAVLQVEAHSEQVIVRGERERGEVEALNREMNADNIVQVLPAEVITSLPNTNIADAVGRLPSVSLERDEGEGKYVQIRGRCGRSEERLLQLRSRSVARHRAQQ